AVKLTLPMVVFMLPAMFITLGGSSFLHLIRAFTLIGSESRECPNSTRSTVFCRCHGAKRGLFGPCSHFVGWCWLWRVGSNRDRLRCVLVGGTACRYRPTV